MKLDLNKIRKLIREIERECIRTANTPDVYDNAQMGLTFRAVWWKEIKPLLEQLTEKL